MDRASRITRRSLLAVPLALPLAGRAFAADAPALPILPFGLDFSFWDHHWIQWLPTHPVYERAEVALIARSGSGPLVDFRLTERAGAKRQVHYSNDPAIAAGFPQPSHAVAMKVQLMPGQPGMPPGLTLSFAGQARQEVAWTIGFTDAIPLAAKPAGPISQGAGPASAGLQFDYGNAGALGSGTLTLDGSRYAAAGNSANPMTGVSYSAGAYFAAIRYATIDVAPTAEGFTAGARSFVRTNGRYIARFDAFGQPASIELRCAADNALLAYRQSHGRHVLALDFDGALAIQGKAVGFGLDFDNRDVAGGTVTPADGATLHWDFADPDWARKTSLRTTIAARTNGGYSAQVAPAR